MVPAEQPTSPSEVARLLPPAIKLLRTLKFCDDACSEPRTEVGVGQGGWEWCGLRWEISTCGRVALCGGCLALILMWPLQPGRPLCRRRISSATWG